MTKIKRKQLRNWGACYSATEIAELVPLQGITLAQLLNLGIPDKDKLWVLLHKPILAVKELRLLACRWATKACKLAKIDGNPIIKNAIKVARRHAKGLASSTELDKANQAVFECYDEANSSNYEAFYATFCATTPTTIYQQSSYNASDALVWTALINLIESPKASNITDQEPAKNPSAEKIVALCLKQTIAVLKKEGKL